MEINYDLIIKYLSVIKNNFASKKHILVYSDTFPDKFKTLLQNKFYRYGIDQNIDDSFYISLLILLNKSFLTYTPDEELEEIGKFKKLFNKENNKNDIVTMLDINLIIFDFKNENIDIIYPDKICNPYKVTLLLAQYENCYEPIMNEMSISKKKSDENDNKKLFSFNDIIIKNIFQSVLENNINYNIDEILKDFKPNNKIENEIFIKSDNDLNKKFLKMTKKELLVILNNKNIKIDITKMLKKDIINLISNN